MRFGATSDHDISVASRNEMAASPMLGAPVAQALTALKLGPRAPAMEIRPALNWR